MFKIETRKRGQPWVRLGGSYATTDEAHDKIAEYRQHGVTLYLGGQTPKHEYRIVRV